MRMRGDGRDPVKWETAANQRKALDALLRCFEARRAYRACESAGPPFRPGPPSIRQTASCFRAPPATAFDPLSPGTLAADVTIGFVLQLDRAARMVAQHAVDPALPSLEEVIDRLTKATFDAAAATPYEAEIRRSEERVLVDRMIWLATGSPNAQVRAIAALKLTRLAARLKAESASSEAEQAQRALLAADIKRFLDRPAERLKPIVAADAPPGAPIGGDAGMGWLDRPPY